MTMPDLQLYTPRNINLIKIVKDTVVFLTETVFCEALHCFISARNTQGTFSQKPRLKNKKNIDILKFKVQH